MLGCAGLFLAGGASIFAFGACLALIGFMLFGPDSLLSGAGAVDIGSPRTAVAAAGIINDPSIDISASSLEGLNEVGKDDNIATGYHACL